MLLCMLLPLLYQHTRARHLLFITASCQARIWRSLQSRSHTFGKRLLIVRCVMRDMGAAAACGTAEAQAPLHSAARLECSVGSRYAAIRCSRHGFSFGDVGDVVRQVALTKPKCQAGGDCARTRAALNWPDHLPCVDPSKVSVPVDKSIALLKWFESLGHSVPELRELEAIKRRWFRAHACTMHTCFPRGEGSL